jgi:hypothetical protein
VTDVREDILARLLEVVAGIPNIRWAQRNNLDIPDDQFPAVIVLDGDEESNGISDIGGSRPGNRPYVVQMTPYLVFIEQANAVGTEISAFRREGVKRVLNDAPLIALVGTNGAIRYISSETDFGWGRSLQGALIAQFTFKYVLKIEEL